MCADTRTIGWTRLHVNGRSDAVLRLAAPVRPGDRAAPEILIVFAGMRN